ncbi:MAG TPA: DUF6390 family protein [Egibacteraceae bacterium]|nr:DUF6390 family protein [Egibacteraceae bacterium]
MAPTSTAPGNAGALLFARYAYPPNARGYCGPADHRALLEYGATGAVDPGLRELARGFSGAWPYYQLIATAAGIDDPLDPRVGEAYWVGSPLLDQVDMSVFGRSLESRFRGPAGKAWGRLAEAVPAGGVPHHSFHVFCVYPWIGLLGAGVQGEKALEVLDRCRIRWGQVVTASGDQVVVGSRPLRWDGRSLSLGPRRLETATRAERGLAFVAKPAAGDWVSLHWDWMCERLTPARLRHLVTYTARTLRLANQRLSRSGAAALLG